MNRRKLLATTAGLTATTLAGCLGSEDDPSERTDNDSGTTDENGEDTTEQPTAQLDNLDVAELTYQGLELKPTFQATNPADETHEIQITISIGSQTHEITETITGNASQHIETTIPTTEVSFGSQPLVIESGDSTLKQAIEVKPTTTPGIYGIITPPENTDRFHWRIEGITFDTESETVYATRETFESTPQDFHIDHPSAFDADEQRQPPYDMTIEFEKHTPDGFTGIPDAYTLDSEVSITEDTTIIGRYDLPEAQQIDVQLLDNNGDPVSNSEHVWIRIPGGKGIGTYETDADGYIKHTTRNESGLEVTGQITIEYEIGGDHSQKTDFDITVTEEDDGEEFIFTINEL